MLYNGWRDLFSLSVPNDPAVTDLNRQFMFFCDKFHIHIVGRVSLFISVLYSLFITLLLFYLVRWDNLATVHLTEALVCALMWLVTLLVLGYALLSDRPSLALPYVVWSIAYGIRCVVGSIHITVMIFNHSIGYSFLTYLLLIAFAFGAAVYLLTPYVVLMWFTYDREYKRLTMTSGTAGDGANGPSVYAGTPYSARDTQTPSIETMPNVTVHQEL